MGRALDPVWDHYYRLDADFTSLGLKAMANTAHHNGWCKNCVKVALAASDIAGWTPDEAVLQEAGGSIEQARRYKAMSIISPLTGVPRRLRNHLGKCTHSRHIVLAPPVIHHKSSHDPFASPVSASSKHATPASKGKHVVKSEGEKLNDEEQAEFNVHLFHLFVGLEVPFEATSNAALISFFAKYVPQATLPSRSLLYTLAASRNIVAPLPTGTPDFHGLARLAAGFGAAVAEQDGVGHSVEPGLDQESHPENLSAHY
ncbi:hypothetical protein IAT38_001240 [Cryptococcus sp. DSM 104549]